MFFKIFSLSAVSNLTLALPNPYPCISEDGFQELQDQFLNEHCDQFEDEEENKLIYTDIYNQYISILEGYIANRMMELCPKFKMSTLLELIQ